MLRRIVRFLRVSLFALGVVLAVMLPTSFIVKVQLLDPYPMREVLCSIEPGFVRFFAVNGRFAPDEFKTEVSAQRARPMREKQGFAIRPFFLRMAGPHGEGRIASIGLPLWLLAVIFLAWPVTSFIVARRRRKARGFEVEPKKDNAVSTSDS